MERVVVVGASLAGHRAAETLLAEGFTGEVVVVGDEPHLPYDRPPLSKRVLSGEWEPDRAQLRKPDDLAALPLTWRTGVAAVGLDLDRRVVALADGSSEPFDGLIIATGATPRRIPGQDAHADVHVLRTLDDSLALRARLADGPGRVVVIGAGFIGLEVAATARTLGHAVVVLEGAEAPLIRGLGAEIGRAVAAVHTDHGVEVRCGVGVTGFERDAVLLAGGERVAADVLVVGIGVAPSTGWLAGSGLTLDDGVVCGPDLSALGADLVYAAGDVVRWHHPTIGASIRVEHWTNAAEQGAVAAKNLLAEAAGATTTAYDPVPFFWSEQYDRRIQFLGRRSGDDDVVVFAGSVDERRFAALYSNDDRLTAVVGMNMPKQVMPWRNHLAAGISLAEAMEVAAELAG